MIAKGNGPLLPLDEVRTHISDFEILRYYLGVTSVPTVINNPTRKDERPSLGIYTSNGQTVAVRDFATGYSNSLVGFLAELWHTNLEATLAKIITEIPLISKGNKIWGKSSSLIILTPLGLFQSLASFAKNLL